MTIIIDLQVPFFINLMKTLTLDFAMILFLNPYNIFSLNDIKRVRNKINHSFAQKILKTVKSAPDRCFTCLRLVNLKQLTSCARLFEYINLLD